MSDFPNPISFNQYDTQAYLSKLNTSSDRIPLVLKKIKGIYLYDINGYKYSDFNLQNGEISFAYTHKSLTKIYKNALSAGIGHADCYNKFLLKAYRYWEELAQNKVSFFSHPVAAILSFLKKRKNNDKIYISCSSNYLYRIIEPLNSIVDIGFCDKEAQSDLLLYEPIFEDGSIFDIDCYSAYQKLAVYTRFFFRQQLDFNDKYPILLSHFLAGEPLTILVDPKNTYDHDSKLSIYETVLFMEGAKYLKKQMKKKIQRYSTHF